MEYGGIPTVSQLVRRMALLAEALAYMEREKRVPRERLLHSLESLSADFDLLKVALAALNVGGSFPGETLTKPGAGRTESGNSDTEPN